MAKKGSPTSVPSTIVKEQKPKPNKPKVVEVDSPVIYKGEGGTLYALDVKDGPYLTTDSDMDDSDITVKVWNKDGGGQYLKISWIEAVSVVLGKSPFGSVT